MNTTSSLLGQADDPVAASLADLGVLRRLQNAAIAMLRRSHIGLPITQRLAEAEEVLQEAARRALARRNDFDAAKSVVQWLVGFVVMVCRERTRSRSAAQIPAATMGDDPIPLEEIVADLHCPVEDTVANRLDARQMLDRLPIADQELVRLRFFEDASAADIGRQLGLSPGAVRVRLCRAILRLKDDFAKREGAQP